MKISKLFHWLYALLMLLPFVFFVPSVLYYAFNDNATMQSVEVPKTETIAVDFNQQYKKSVSRTFDVTEDFTITFNAENIVLNGQHQGAFNVDLSYGVPLAYGHTYIFKCYMPSNVSLQQNYYTQNGTQAGATLRDNTPSVKFTNYLDNVTPFTYVFGNNVNVVEYNEVVLQPMLFDLTKMNMEDISLQDFDLIFSEYYPYTESELMQITYDTGETMQLVENTSIVNYAWESIWDLPLFSWTKVTFIAVPFTYITGLFGLASSNTINYVFGYFLSISIVWLVFDVIMYVPLLCHRWIDKARIE